MSVSLTHKFVSTIADGSTTYTGSLTNGSPTITGCSPTPPSTAVGYKVYGSGIPTETTITAVSGTTITLSGNATVTASSTFYTGDGQVQPSDWNDQHTLTMATNNILGRASAGTGTVEEIGIGSGLSLTGGQLVSTGASTGKAIAMAIVFGG